MKLSGLHILLTYQCTFECDHCFVWGSPWQSGTLTLEQIENILLQAKDARVESIYFEGGEPFLYYALLTRGVELAHGMGFHVGIVSNAYWAHTSNDALEWLRPFAGKIEDLSVSGDLFHYSDTMNKNTQNAVTAAGQLGIPIGVISVCQPEETEAASSHGMIETGGAGVMYRGRAISKLVPRAALHPWDGFDSCPHEDLREPGRAHLDPLGNLHVCQGVSLGNIFEKPLTQICEEYDADTHPICGPLLNGGPVALVTEYNLPHASSYADACHLCYEARTTLRPRFPECLHPDQMYGVIK
ncbi:MAG: radical SAM protein [Anaerolineales bacterium]|nr:radical SAM protein [Anaerolineales bacterium]